MKGTFVASGKKWEHFRHEADIGVKGWGQTRDEAFEQAGVALMNVVADTNPIEERESRLFACRASTDDFLLVEWLNALIYAMAVEKVIFRRFEVTIDGPSLRAKAWGEKIEIARHRPAVEIKGATLTELKVFRDRDGLWCAQCVVDV